MATHNITNSDRKAAIKLLATGLASPAEVANISGASKQLVRYWCNTAGINWRKARKAYLTKAWRRFYRP